jgi:hypothetical protein
MCQGLSVATIQPYQLATSEDKQSALDDAWESCAPLNLPLRQILRNNEKSSRATTPNGTSVKQAFSNGHSGMAHEPGTATLTPVAAQRLWRELIDLFDRGILYLNNPNPPVPTYCYVGRDYTRVTLTLPITNPTDAQVDGYMRDHLLPVSESQNDYGMARLIGTAYA